MNFTYKLIRCRRKTICIMVTPKAEVIVKAPKNIDNRLIDRFLLEKEKWVNSKVEQIKARQYLLPTLFAGETITYLGGERLISTCTVSIEASVGDGYLLLPNNEAKKALKKHAKNNLVAFITPIIDKYVLVSGITYKSIGTSNASKRWGSCNNDKKLLFSLGIALLPIELVEYVALHELCHTVYLNHGKDFYSLIAEYMPDYKERISALKSYSPLCGYFAEE